MNYFKAEHPYLKKPNQPQTKKPHKKNPNNPKEWSLWPSVAKLISSLLFLLSTFTPCQQHLSEKEFSLCCFPCCANHLYLKIHLQNCFTVTGQQIKVGYQGVNALTNRLPFCNLSNIPEKILGSSLVLGLKILLENEVLYFVAGDEIFFLFLVLGSGFPVSQLIYVIITTTADWPKSLMIKL